MLNHKLGTIGIKEISICKCISLCARKWITLNLEKFLFGRFCLPIYLFRKKKKEREREISWRSFKICKRVCFIGEVKDEKNKFESNCEQI